jgi:hypothetical protein
MAAACHAGAWFSAINQQLRVEHSVPGQALPSIVRAT